MASNVYKTHIEQFFEGDLDFKKVEEKESCTLSSTKSDFILKLIKIFKSISLSESEKNQLLEFINFLEAIPSQNFDSEKFILNHEENRKSNSKISCLNSLKAVRHLILNLNYLTKNEKADCCKIERGLMKIYLNQILSKYQDIN